MTYVIGGAVALFAGVLLVGALTGRVKSSSCCSIADPRQDKRMSAAFRD